MKNLYTISIVCADQPGLIAAISGTLFKHNLNILAMKEFVSTDNNQFFVRLEVEGTADVNTIKEEMIALLPKAAFVQFHPLQNKDLVILATKEHHCLSDLLVRHHFGELQANIKAVISNYDTLRDITERFGIPFFTVPHVEKTKDEFENQIAQMLHQFQPDFIVLAKFMRILSPSFVAQFQHKIINIHHSFLPAFIGANPYKQAYQRGVKLIGATAHFVTNDLDEGPIITQKVIDADHEYTVKGMVNAGHEVEKIVLAEALKLVLEDRVFVSENKTIIFE